MSGALVILALLASPAPLSASYELAPACVVRADHPGALPPRSQAPFSAAWWESSDLDDNTLDIATFSAAHAATLVPPMILRSTQSSSGAVCSLPGSLITQHVRLQI